MCIAFNNAAFSVCSWQAYLLEEHRCRHKTAYHAAVRPLDGKLVSRQDSPGYAASSHFEVMVLIGPEPGLWVDESLSGHCDVGHHYELGACWLVSSVACCGRTCAAQRLLHRGHWKGTAQCCAMNILSMAQTLVQDRHPKRIANTRSNWKDWPRRHPVSKCVPAYAARAHQRAWGCSTLFGRHREIHHRHSESM